MLSNKMLGGQSYWGDAKPIEMDGNMNLELMNSRKKKSNLSPGIMPDVEKFLKQLAKRNIVEFVSDGLKTYHITLF